MTYQCVPRYPIGSTLNLNVYDICDTNNSIVGLNNIVASPGFPSYTQTNNECQRAII
ncbi:unnamed protein product, partial [Rotaria sp. Silwood2]